MAATKYPDVVGEIETLEKLHDGFSVARYGDGEFNLAVGRKCVSQIADPRLQAELCEILVAKHRECLVGIPTMAPEGPKYGNWIRYADRYARLLSPKKRYYSAFISRPDSAPWTNTATYFDRVEDLWRDQDVTLVANGVRSLKPEALRTARSVRFVQCSYRDSYEQIESLYADCVSAGNLRVVLCAGPAATCLAYRLSRTTIGGARMQGLDLGHIGMFWRRYTEQFVEQREINVLTNEVGPNP